MLIIFFLPHHSHLAQGRPGERHIENRFQPAEHIERLVRAGLCKPRLSAERTAERATVPEQHQHAATAAVVAAAAEADTADEAEPDEVRSAGRQAPGATSETEASDQTTAKTDERWLNRVRETHLQ